MLDGKYDKAAYMSFLLFGLQLALTTYKISKNSHFNITISYMLGSADSFLLALVFISMTQYFFDAEQTIDDASFLHLGFLVIIFVFIYSLVMRSQF